MNQQVEQTIVPNEVYNMIRAFADELKGLAADNTYAQDGGSRAQLRQQDEQALRQLQQQLAQQGQRGCQ